MKKALRNKEKKFKLTTLGFTLIELLVVIIVLAIIVLIAMPIIFNIKEKGKVKSLENSAYGVIDAVRLQYMEDLMDTDNGEIALNGSIKTLPLSEEHPTTGILKIENEKEGTNGKGIKIQGVKFDSISEYVCDSEETEQGKLTLKVAKPEPNEPKLFSNMIPVTYNAATAKRISNSYSASTETFTKSQMQDMIVSTALSYWYNGYYSDYGQKPMDGIGVGSNYYNLGTFYWRNLNITPEMVGRGKYYHIDCSGFTFNTYFNTFGYDMSEYKDLNSYTLFYSDETYKMNRVNKYGNTAFYYKEAYKKFNQAWNNLYLIKVANKISDTCSNATCSSSNKTGVLYDNLDNSKNTELAYYYVANGHENVETLQQAYAKVKEKLEPGDILIYYINSNNTRNGHVMLYVGQPNGISEKSLIHSGGTDYSTSDTSNTNQLRKAQSIVRSISNTYIDNQIINAENNGNYMDAFVVFRPINTMCKSNTDCKISYNKNNVLPTNEQVDNSKARVDLNDIKIEQWMSENKKYSTSLNPTTNATNSSTVNILSELNSINKGDQLIYNLRFLNKYDENQATLTISASIPKGAKFVRCQVNDVVNNTCVYKDGHVVWENITIPKTNKYRTYQIVVEAVDEGTIIFNGMKIATAEGNNLQMSELKVSVYPTQNGLNKEILKSKVDKFKSLVEEGKITYNSASSGNDNLKDLNTLTSASVSQFGFVKMVYYNAFGLDLDRLNNTITLLNTNIIRDSIFKQIQYPKTNNDGTTYEGSTTEKIYTILSNEEITSLTGVNAIINKMMVPGLYGGKYLKGNDNGNRINFLRSFVTTTLENQSDLEYGDIIVTYLQNNTAATVLLYLGLDEYGPVLARYERNNGLVIYTDKYLKRTNYNENNCSKEVKICTGTERSGKCYNESNEEIQYKCPAYYEKDNYNNLFTSKDKPSNQILNELFEQNLFVVLRPSRIASTIQYDYNEGIEGTKSYVAYKTYKNLVTPTKEHYILTLNYGNKKEEEKIVGENTFAGWYSDLALTKKVTNETNLASTTSHTLYAKWNNKEIILPSSTISGYTLEGWYSDSALTNKVSDLNKQYTIDSTETLYAKWEPITYEVNYDANGGTGTMLSSTHNYNEQSTLNSNTFIRNGYTFKGWSTSSIGSVVYTNKASIKNLTTAGNKITLYAVWELNKYTVTFNANGGNMSLMETIVNHGETLGTIESPKKEGYSFDAWYIDSKLTIKFDIKTKITSNMTLFAKYTKIIVSVIRGDANIDGKISALDYVKIKNHIMKQSIITNSKELYGADMNADGKISALDYVAIKNKIMKG